MRAKLISELFGTFIWINRSILYFSYIRSMKRFIMIVVLGVLMGCASAPKSALPKVTPNSPEAAAAIETQIRSAAEKPEGELTTMDLDKVTMINLESSGISDLGELKKLKQLKALYLRDNSVTDINALRGLTKLEYLQLSSNQLVDADALGELRELEWLDLVYNNLTDTSALATLKKLKVLNLAGQCPLQSGPRLTDVNAPLP